jgi:hypothetical protein
MFCIVLITVATILRNNARVGSHRPGDILLKITFLDIFEQDVADRCNVSSAR